MARKKISKYRKKVDWESIEPEWAAGQLSKSEIGRRHDVSVPAMIKHFEKDGLVYGSLRSSIRLKIDAKLVENPDEVKAQVKGFKPADVIDDAAEIGANVIRLQRKDIAQQFERKARAEKLLDKIKIPEGDEELSLEDVQSVKIYAETLGSLVRTMGILIDKQRQAYSLDEEQAGSSDDKLSALLSLCDKGGLPR